jgi:hypothetical protein
MYRLANPGLGYGAEIKTFQHQKLQHNYIAFRGQTDPPETIGQVGDLYTKILPEGQDPTPYFRASDGWQMNIGFRNMPHPTLGGSRVLDNEKMLWVSSATFRVRSMRQRKRKLEWDDDLVGSSKRPTYALDTGSFKNLSAVCLLYLN